MRNALRQLTLRTGSAKTAGRNSQGRITSFHRGGGAKRLQRIVDLKRSTSAMGIVERIEYDPNRSSRLALVRWVDGVKLPRPRKRNNDVDFKPMGGGVVEEMGKGDGDVATPSKVMESTTATIGSYFSCSALLPEKVEPRKVHCVVPSGLMAAVGAPNGKIIPPPSNTQNSSGSTMKTSAKDVFVSALSSSTKGSGESNGYLSLPRIAVAGAKPTFFTPQLKEEVKEENNTVTLCEVRKWTPQSIVWSHRIKPKAALSWLSFRRQESLGLVGATDRNLSKLPNTDQGGGSMPGKPTGGPKQDGSCTEERTPVSYIIASDQLEVGKMVMNCDWSKSSTKGSGQSARSFQDLGNMGNKGQADWGADRYEILDLNSQIGNCIPLTDIRIGTWVHDIECKPGQGAKMVRAAGTSAKVVKEPGKLCTLRLPSGAEKIIDSRCRATVGKVSNINHDDRKLRKAGHSRWLGRRPVVRGVAMNPVDHPHGGGEGRTKGGRPSVSPWGKPTKAGYKTAGRKRR